MTWVGGMVTGTLGTDTVVHAVVTLSTELWTHRASGIGWVGAFGDAALCFFGGKFFIFYSSPTLSSNQSIL